MHNTFEIEKTYKGQNIVIAGYGYHCEVYWNGEYIATITSTIVGAWEYARKMVNSHLMELEKR